MSVLRQYIPSSCSESCLLHCKKAILAQEKCLFLAATCLSTSEEYLLAQQNCLGALQTCQPTREKSMSRREKCLLAQQTCHSQQQTCLSVREKCLHALQTCQLAQKKCLFMQKGSCACRILLSILCLNNPYLSSNGNRLPYNEARIRGLKTCCRPPPG